MVKSYSEQQIDDWFYDNGWYAVYEPTIVINNEEFKPDWVLWPQRDFDKPIIVEYWGLLREQVSPWVIKKKERYLARKEYKENIYSGSDNYYFVGVLPHQIDIIEELLEELL